MSGLICLAIIELLVGTSAPAAQWMADGPVPADGAAFVDPDAQLPASWSIRTRTRC